MINGEGWLENGIQCELKIIPVVNYHHKKIYNLPIKPSPNLPNAKAVNLYSSLCFFEGTNVSSGRGTSTQFQVYGSPFLNLEKYNYVFTPKPNLGAKNPMHNGVKCFGKDLTDSEFLSSINLEWLIDAYINTSNKSDFFNPFFTKLAGQTKLQQQIESGKSANTIRESWQKELEAFKKIRANYLLYP